MGFSVDAGSLTSGTTHIFAAVKTMDIRSKNKSGELMFVEYDENGNILYKNLQRNANVFIMCMAYSRDGKEPYKQFLGDWFKFIQTIKKEGLPYRDENNPAIKPILARLPQDASSIQKGLNMGGACKACDLFCHLCACRSYGASSQLFEWREAHLRCRQFCLNQEDPPKRCYHWAVDDDIEIEQKNK